MDLSRYPSDYYIRIACIQNDEGWAILSLRAPDIRKRDQDKVTPLISRHIWRRFLCNLSETALPSDVPSLDPDWIPG